ncbi:hypothetical protein X975_06904, partial [Stegodyphus mimosarum]
MWISKDGSNVEFVDSNTGMKYSIKEARHNPEFMKRFKNDLVGILFFMASKDEQVIQ